MIAPVGLLLLFLAACHTDPKNPSASDKSTVIKKLQAEVNKKPDSVGVRLLLVNALDEAGNYKDAIAQMDSLLKKDSANYGLWFRKGQLLQTAKDTPGAISSFTNALKVYASPDGMLWLANLLAETKNPDALLLCKQVYDMRLGKEYMAHCDFIAGVFYSRSGNKKVAQQLFDRCINDSYTYTAAYLEKGFISFDDKKFAEALKIFQTASAVNNTDPQAYYWQARCFEAMNNKTNAITNYQKALALDKNLSEAAEGLKRLQ